MINPFRQWNIKNLPLLNKMWAKLEILGNMRGDGLVRVTNSSAGTNISLNMNAVRRRMGSNKGGGGSGVTRAACTADAGAGSTIAATLFKTDGTTGDAITVYCNISNGTDLNTATPRLVEEDEMFVVKSNFATEGDPVSRYYCVSNFQASDDCDCVQPDHVFNSIAVASDEKISLDGVLDGDTFIRHNSADSEVEHTVETEKVTTW